MRSASPSSAWASPAPECFSPVGLEQPVEVDDHIFHLGVVDRALGLAAPGVLGGRETVVDPDQIDRFQVDELKAARDP